MYHRALKILHLPWDEILHIIYAPNVMFCIVNLTGTTCCYGVNFWCKSKTTGYLCEGECTIKSAHNYHVSQDSFDQMYATYEPVLCTLVNKEEESLLWHYSSHPKAENLAMGSCWYDSQGRHNGNLKQHAWRTVALQRRRECFLCKLLNNSRKPFHTFYLSLKGRSQKENACLIKYI